MHAETINATKRSDHDSYHIIHSVLLKWQFLKDVGRIFMDASNTKKHESRPCLAGHVGCLPKCKISSTSCFS